MNSFFSTYKRKTLLIVFIILAFISSLVLLTKRISIEKNNKTVEIVMTYKDLLDMSRREFIPFNELLKKVKKSGVTSISFVEINLNQLKEQGQIQWMSGSDLKMLVKMTQFSKKIDISNLKPGSVYAFNYSPEMGTTLKNNLKIFFGPQAAREIKIQLNENRYIYLIEICGNPQDLPFEGLGFDNEIIKKVNDLGFSIILRPENHIGLNNEKIKKYMSSIGNIPGAVGIIFGGKNEVLGYPQFLEATVEGFQKNSLSFGYIEVPNVQARQKGAQFIALKIPQNTVRVMSINPLYLAKLNPDQVIDKFRLGVRERNIRLLFIRPFLTGFKGKNVLNTNLSYISQLKKELSNFHFKMGPASRFPKIIPSALWVILISLGAGSMVLLFMDIFYEDKGLIGLIVMMGILVFSLVMALTGRVAFLQKIIGLLIALIFPVYAFSSRLEYMKFKENDENFLKVFWDSLKNFFIITLITLGGGLIIAGLFSSTTYMVTADQFRGIKVVMNIPPIIMLVLFYIQLGKEKGSLKDILMQPLFIWQVVVVGAIGAIWLFYNMRTGNAGQAMSSSSEASLRVVLEQVFWVRPRFKDFVIGHPAMILLGALSYLKVFTGAGLVVLFASLGQVDIIDTFAHIHTPVFISIVRILWGIVLGTVFGSLFYTIFWYVRKIFKLKVIKN